METKNHTIMYSSNDIKCPRCGKHFNSERGLSQYYRQSCMFLNQSQSKSIYMIASSSSTNQFKSTNIMEPILKRQKYLNDSSFINISKNDNLQFKDIIVEYKPVISLPIILAESVYLQGMDIEIGYDKDIFEPLSITFNSLNQQSENYESLSNLFSHEGTIKTVTWAADDPQLINGIIGEVSFTWKNKNKGGKIWLENIQVNDVSAGGGISLTSFNGEEIATGVNIINKLFPEKINLQQNYPNPFNPQTTIYWSLPNSGNASIDVYNIQGQLISHLFDGYIEPGTHEQLWNASGYPSGIYFYRLTIGENVLQKKMILLQ